jgi:chromosome partitioning protein
MARVIAICNQKGGVGKTTTSVNLGAYLASLGRSVLLIDFDPQANASSALGHNKTLNNGNIYQGITGEKKYEELISKTVINNYHYIPSASHLAGALIELVDMPEREYFLRKFINSFRHQYDYILIDLPPSLSLLTINGMVASDEIIIPVQTEYYSLEGLGQLLETIDLIKENLSHHIKISGALITMYDKRSRLSRDVAKSLRDNFPHYVYNVMIPRSVALAEAPSFSKPILLYKPDTKGADAYKMLANEVILQENNSYNNDFMSDNFGNFNI